MRSTSAFLAALLLAGCAVGPDYHPPAVRVSAKGPLLGAVASPAVSTSAAEDAWWRLYDDPVLDGLVQDALAANTDLRVALARLERARASLDLARSGQLPSTTVDAGVVHQRLPGTDVLPGGPAESWRADAGLTVGYEVDLFGGVRRRIEAANGDLDAVAAEADAVRVAVVADTIRAYVDASAAAERLAAASHTVALLDQSRAVTASRADVGRGETLDVLRITALRDEQAAVVPRIEADRGEALFRLAMLTGRTPEELPAAAGARTAPPSIARPIPVGDGAALLARRPDVRAAERTLASYTARIGVATADLYPHIVLGGAIGGTTNLGDMTPAGALRFLVGPLITWNGPNMTPTLARIAAAKADAKGALAAFDGTVLRALRETETALAVYASALDARAAQRARVDNADAAARVVRERQREGQTDFLTVLDAERAAADANGALALADARVATAQVDLFKALGGGWGTANAPPLVAMADGRPVH
jgi:multidrug efflux system outer membrane protein